jgi:hypothetical protein
MLTPGRVIKRFSRYKPRFDYVPYSWIQLFAFGTIMKLLPSECPLRSIKLNNGSRNREQAFGCIMSINNLPVITFHNTIQHIEMSFPNDQQAG